MPSENNKTRKQIIILLKHSMTEKIERIKYLIIIILVVIK